MKNSHILVLGVGNLLLSDEGAGIHCIHKLEESYTFTDNVHLLDGGTLGMRLLDSIRQASYLIVADVALRGCVPGTISRLTINDVRCGCGEMHSMHELSFSETLSLAETLEVLPPTVIIAIEPLDMTTMSVSLTAEVAEKLDEFCLRMMEEIKIAGGGFSLKQS
jgi:hydrogenase maturation protease